jgi:hypothetical protein
MKPAPARRPHRAKTASPESAHEQHGEHDDERGRSRGMRDRGQQRPAEENVAEAARCLPHDQRGDGAAPCPRRATRAVQAPGERRQRRQEHERAEAMRHVDRGQRRERQERRAAAAAERAAQDETLADVHVRPPGALASRKVAAGEDGVVAAHPAAECDLDDGERGDDDEADAQPLSNRKPARRVALGLDREQREQGHPAEQMQRHDRRIETQRHGERAERALDADPEQRDERPARLDAAIGTPRGNERERGEDEDKNADRGRRIAMRHLDPGLGNGHCTARYRGFGGSDRRARAERRRVAVAAGPVGTAETRVAQAGEGAEQDQVEAQHEDEQRQRVKPCGRVGTALPAPEPEQRHAGDENAGADHAERRREVVARDAGVHRPARSQPAEARSSRSMSRFRRAGSASTGARIIQSPRGSTM